MPPSATEISSPAVTALESDTPESKTTEPETAEPEVAAGEPAAEQPAIIDPAIAEWLDNFRDEVHPRADDGDLGARVAALGSLELPTVVFPLQYAALCGGRRIGAVTYRSWMIASGEVKPRAGEQKHPSATLTE